MKRRIRVVLVIPTLTRGGAERQLVTLFQGLDRGRFEPTIVLFDDKGEKWYEAQASVGEIRSLGIPAGGNFRAKNAPYLMRGALRLARLFKELRPDVVHAFLPAPAVIGAIACKLSGVPVFIVGRRNMAGFHRRGSRILEYFDRFPLRFSSGLIGNCQAIADEAVALDGLAPDRSFMVFNGLDTKTFHPGRAAELRSEFGFREDHLVFGTIASFHYRKRHVDFVKAAATVHAQAPHSRFLLVGVDQGTLGEVKQQIAAAGLDAAFKIVGQTDRPQDFYRALDVYVSSSEVEGLSNSIMEAMATGLPVIATNVGGNAELVADGQSGFIIPAYSPERMAECALALAKDEALRRNMGQKGLEAARTKFSIEAMVQSHEAIYTELLRRAGGGGAS